jgi:hypothetical protein
MGIPVGEMLRRMTASELTEYMAYDQIEPIGEPRADLRLGILAATVANHSASPPRQAAKPVDFMPFARAFTKAFEQPADVISLEDPQARAQLLGKTLFGDRVVRYTKDED